MNPIRIQRTLQVNPDYIRESIYFQINNMLKSLTEFLELLNLHRLEYFFLIMMISFTIFYPRTRKLKDQDAKVLHVEIYRLCP